jgi:hypothetical protein
MASCWHDHDGASATASIVVPLLVSPVWIKATPLICYLN